MKQNDAVLVNRVLLGEKTAFGPLVHRRQAGAMRLALRMLDEPAEVEEVVQEAFLQAFLGLRSLRAPGHFGSWLLGIVVNLCRMRLRHRQEVSTWDDWAGGRVPPDFIWADTWPSPQAVYEAQELHRTVLDAIATLPAVQQDAVRWHYFDGLTLGEISLLVGVPVGTIKARLHRARAQLRGALADASPTVRPPGLPMDKERAMIEVTVHDACGVSREAKQYNDHCESKSGRNSGPCH